MGFIIVYIRFQTFITSTLLSIWMMQNRDLFCQILILPNLDFQILEEFKLETSQIEIKNSIHFSKTEFHRSLICFELTVLLTQSQELKWISISAYFDYIEY